MFALDPYAARSCPVKTLHAFGEPSTHPTLTTLSFPGAAEFTASVYAQIAATHPDVCDLRQLNDSPAEEQEAACLAAMAEQAPVILGGLLPRDWDGHRRGRVDVLIRLDDGYVPGLIKFQRALDTRRDDREFTYSTLDALPQRLTTVGWRYRWNWRWANTLQLAHLWELLGPTGFRSSACTAAILGTDRLDGDHSVATWLDLEEPNLSPGTDAPITDESVGAITRYRSEFARRVMIAETALAKEPPPAGLLPPIVTSECRFCDWWSRCRPLLDDDDLSLRVSKAPLTRLEVSALRSCGISTLTQLATADLDALLVNYLPLLAHRPGADERLQIAQRRARLLAEGTELERLSTGPIPLPTAELEIDIDVETSRHDRVYLWGFWVHDGDQQYYRHFSSFTDLDQAGELALAVEAMTWLRDLVAGRDAKAFHYSDYEVVRIARLATSDPTMKWALAFAHAHFVDLFDLVRHHFFGASGLGLKVVAQAGAGFHWRDEEPGGLNSMSWFDNAVHAETSTEREQARERVLCYNEDDVRATARLRAWLRELS